MIAEETKEGGEKIEKKREESPGEKIDRFSCCL